MNKYHLSLFISTILLSYFSSCETRPSNIIDGGEYKYWEIDKVFSYYYYFDNDGNFAVYSKYDNELYLYKEDDAPSNYWYLIGSDSLCIAGYEYKFHKLSEDSILLEFKGKIIDTLTAVPKEDIPKKFRRKHKIK